MRYRHLLLLMACVLPLVNSLSFAQEFVLVQSTSPITPPEPAATDLDADAIVADTADDSENIAESESDCPSIQGIIDSVGSIATMSASIKSYAIRPADCSEGLFLDKRPAGAFQSSVVPYHWQAVNFFHRPLYFDDTPLERYGQTMHPLLQPVISGGRFFGTFLVLPYKMGIDRPHDCVSTAGYYRPGSCAPCTRERLLPAFETDAALLEAATALALVFVLP